MTAGARDGLDDLHEKYGSLVRFVSMYVREAHPGENYPHHTSLKQKIGHARDWAEQDEVTWTVAVDELEGATHRAYGGRPNSLYLVGSTGIVAFRALWAGQKGLVGDAIEELLEREASGDQPVVIGEEENLVIPLIHGGAEFERAIERAGEKAKADFRREMGNVIYGFQKATSKLRPIMHREDRGK